MNGNDDLQSAWGKRLVFLTAGILFFVGTVCLAAESGTRGPLISVELKEMSLSDAITRISKLSGYRIVLAKGWEGVMVSVNLKEVSLEEALKRCLRNHNYSAVWEDDDKTVYLYVLGTADQGSGGSAGGGGRTPYYPDFRRQDAPSPQDQTFSFPRRRRLPDGTIETVPDSEMASEPFQEDTTGEAENIEPVGEPDEETSPEGEDISDMGEDVAPEVTGDEGPIAQDSPTGGSGFFSPTMSGEGGPVPQDSPTDG